MSGIQYTPAQAAEQRAAGIAKDLLGELLQVSSQAQAVESLAHHLTIAFAEADGPIWATAAGLAAALVPVMQVGIDALRSDRGEP